MSLRSFLFASPAFALVFAASSAFAQEPAPAPQVAPAPQAAVPVEPAPLAAPAPVAIKHFGDAGQVAISVNHGFTVNTTDLIGGGDELQLSYFAIPHLSLGLALGAQYVSSSPPSGGDSQHTLILHVGPRVGYDVRISDAVSFWPQVGIDYRRYDETSSDITVSGSGTTSSTSTTTTNSAVGITVLAPFILHPTQGFFIGAGPAFYTDLSNTRSRESASADQSKILSLGLVATIGGAF